MIYIDSEDRYVCYDCYESFHSECPKCGESCGTSNMQFSEFLEENLCINCLEEIQSLEGTLIFSFCNIANQLFEAPDKEESIKSMYSDIREEERQLIKHYKGKNREVWFTSMVKDLIAEDLNQVSYSERHNLLLAQREHTNKNSNRVVRMDSRWYSPFARLEYSSNEMPMIREIILLGVIDQIRLDEYLTELNISLEALDIKGEVKVDYSKVRVI